MAEKSTQQDTGESSTPVTQERISSRHDITPQKTPPTLRGTWSSRRLTHLLANILCLLVALWYVWSTHDIFGFILLYGIATGAINAREVVGKFLPERSQEQKKTKDNK